jgi:lipid A 3-O-deacylase|tara:strand:- start:693 stop:1376 length:684 start_codon:yes stop_codon:yes gene_type:complete
MKKLVLLLTAIIFVANTHILYADNDRTVSDNNLNKKTTIRDNLKSIFIKNDIKDVSVKKNKTTLLKKKKDGVLTKLFTKKKNDFGDNISLYTGTFDVIDKEGDDKTTLIGAEHKNKDLFRNTWIGRISPTTGAFFTGKNSIYLYTGIEADYNLGPINISPSFAPGYYEAGGGKKLGSVLEFKSEIKVGVDLPKNANLGFSYSHISNNDWGDVNPGTDNQSITFSKKF